MADKIYLVVDYEEGFYETDADSSRIRIVSNNLESLCEKYKNHPIAGQLLIIDESVFNSDLYMTIDDSITAGQGVEVHNFSTYLKNYHKEHNNSNGNKIK